MCIRIHQVLFFLHWKDVRNLRRVFIFEAAFSRRTFACVHARPKPNMSRFTTRWRAYARWRATRVCLTRRALTCTSQWTENAANASNNAARPCLSSLVLTATRLLLVAIFVRISIIVALFLLSVTKKFPRRAYALWNFPTDLNYWGHYLFDKSEKKSKREKIAFYQSSI